MTPAPQTASIDHRYRCEQFSDMMEDFALRSDEELLSVLKDGSQRTRAFVLVRSPAANAVDAQSVSGGVQAVRLPPR